MKSFVFTILSILTIASCQKQGAIVSSPQDNKTDSIAWYVTVMPVEDCMPVYYAKENGIFDSLGVDVRLMEYTSMLDADTALIRGHAQAGYTSFPRVLVYNDESVTNLSPIMSCPSNYQLLTAPGSNIDSVGQLNQRMVAMARYTQAHYWSYMLEEQAGLGPDSIFRPQINDINLRMSMLKDSLVDAAMLPEPLATRARSEGCKPINTVAPDVQVNCFATHNWNVTDTLRQSQQAKFTKALTIAVERLNARVKQKHQAKFMLPANITEENQKKVQHWLNSIELKQ